MAVLWVQVGLSVIGAAMSHVFLPAVCDPDAAAAAAAAVAAGIAAAEHAPLLVIGGIHNGVDSGGRGGMDSGIN